MRSSKRRRLDAELSPALCELAPEIASLYPQLQQQEQVLDASIARAHLRINERLTNPERVPHVIQLHVFNTFANQPEFGVFSSQPQPALEPNTPSQGGLS